MLVDKFAGDFAAILAKPTDAPGLQGRDANDLASLLLQRALNPDQWQESINFEKGSIEVKELTGPLQLFRLYDWRLELKDAWGDWWIEAAPLKQMVEVAARQKNFAADDRQVFVLRLFRSSVCVSPGWKKLYSDIARLDLAHGRTVPAVKGRANPRALGMSPSEMERTLGQWFLPGGVQYFIPRDFIKPILVQRVQRNSPNWPLA